MLAALVLAMLDVLCQHVKNAPAPRSNMKYEVEEWMNESGQVAARRIGQQPLVARYNTQVAARCSQSIGIVYS